MLRYVIRQYQAGVWTLRECATYAGYSIPYTWRILHGQRCKDVMRCVDPSSCSPVYRQPERATSCPQCSTGVRVQPLEAVLGRWGQVTYRCPVCGWSS